MRRDQAYGADTGNQTASAKEQQVLDFLVSDGTSVIEVTVWGEQGEAVLTAYAALADDT